MEMKLNPWLSIWSQPRKVIRQVISTNPSQRLWILAGIYGFPVTLHAAQLLNFGACFQLPIILLIAVVLAPFFGMLGIVIGTWFLSWSGKWLGGIASFSHIKAVVAWANLPSIVSCFVWIESIYLLREQAFTSALPDFFATGIFPVTLSLLLILQAVATVWTFVLLLKGLSEVQGFSVWRAFLNIIIPFVIVTALIWVVLGVLLWLSGMVQS